MFSSNQEIVLVASSACTLVAVCGFLIYRKQHTATTIIETPIPLSSSSGHRKRQKESVGHSVAINMDGEHSDLTFQAVGATSPLADKDKSLSVLVGSSIPASADTAVEAPPLVSPSRPFEKKLKQTSSRESRDMTTILGLADQAPSSPATNSSLRLNVSGRSSNRKISQASGTSPGKTLAPDASARSKNLPNPASATSDDALAVDASPLSRARNLSNAKIASPDINLAVEIPSLSKKLANSNSKVASPDTALAVDIPSLSRKVTNSKSSPSLKSLETETSVDPATAATVTPSSMTSTIWKLQKLSEKSSEKEMSPIPVKHLSSTPSSTDIDTIDNDLHGFNGKGLAQMLMLGSSTKAAEGINELKSMAQISATLKELPFDFALLTFNQLFQTGSAEYRYNLSKRLNDEIKAANLLDHFPLSSKIPLEVFKILYVKKNSPDVFESVATGGDSTFNAKGMATMLQLNTPELAAEGLSQLKSITQVSLVLQVLPFDFASACMDALGKSSSSEFTFKLQKRLYLDLKTLFSQIDKDRMMDNDEFMDPKEILKMLHAHRRLFQKLNSNPSLTSHH